VAHLAFSPDGTILVSAAGAISLWDVATSRRIGSPLQSPTTSVTFSTDGKTLAAGGASQVALWDLDLAVWRERACQIASRNLSAEEWALYLGDEPYRKTCEHMP
jgi:WD40 repeat protein